MDRVQLPPHQTATYVLPQYKLVYVSVPKAACTTLKWLISDLAAEETDRFHGSLSREVTQMTTIHRRNLWRRTPMLHALPEQQLGDITDDNGWMNFAVTRHPAARIWSAWQSKFLMREPLWMGRFAGADWLPRVPSSTDDVVEDFHRFVASVTADPDHPILRDRHFMPQVRLLNHGVTPYTRVYDTSEIPSLLRDLEAHLRCQGWDGALRPIRSNETPLQPIRRAFGEDVLSAIASLYADDLKMLGYDDARPPKLLDAMEYPRVALDAVGMLVERAERIGDLATRDQDLSHSVKQARGELKTTQQELKTARAELKTTRAELKTTRAELKTTRADLKTTRAELKTTRAELNSGRAAAKRLAKALARRVPGLQRVRGSRLEQVSARGRRALHAVWTRVGKLTK